MREYLSFTEKSLNRFGIFTIKARQYLFKFSVMFRKMAIDKQVIMLYGFNPLEHMRIIHQETAHGGKSPHNADVYLDSGV